MFNKFDNKQYNLDIVYINSVAQGHNKHYFDGNDKTTTLLAFYFKTYFETSQNSSDFHTFTAIKIPLCSFACSQYYQLLQIARVKASFCDFRVCTAHTQ